MRRAGIRREVLLLQRFLIRWRRVEVVLVQLGLVVVSYVASFIVRLDLDVQEVPWTLVLKTLPLLIVVRMGIMAVFHLYQGLWRYVSVVDLLQIIKAATVSSLAFAALEILIFGLEGYPRSVFLLDWMGAIFLLSAARLCVRLLREHFRPKINNPRPLQRLLIVGAGDSGAELCKQALTSPVFRLTPVAFIDDNPLKIGNSILGVPIVGRCRDIPQVVDEYGVETVVIAIPSATPSERRRIVDICQRTQVPFKILPGVPDLLSGTVNISRIREVDPADLLGRPPATIDRAVVQSFISGKGIMVTGAGGSVGSALARQIAGLQPRLLLLIDHAENPLLLLESELRDTFPDVLMNVQVSDVTDETVMRRLMAKHRPEVVFHAAAHKHVPLMERTPGEAVKNNIGGTYVLAKCAQEAGVRTFVLVSTDKAVKPTSVMGVTKRLAELLVQEMNCQGSTQFISVRFGNVLGSNASVVPIFKQQIANGGPVTVTHPDARRYFMSLPEAAGLILQAGSVGTGGETFVLDMGEPVKIVDLAETLISLSGLKPYEDIQIVFTGLRPGEKLSEELHFDEEEFQLTEYEKLLKLKNEHPTRGIVAELERLLQVLPTLDAEQVTSRLKDMVPEYHPSAALSAPFPFFRSGGKSS